jgi:hypothetical protein
MLEPTEVGCDNIIMIEAQKKNKRITLYVTEVG